MRARIVCDSSALVAALVDAGPEGRWAADHLGSADVAAPHLLPFEVANVLRRLESGGLLAADQAAQAHADLLDLAVEPWPYALLADRGRELRANLTTYDAAYVALAELLGATLVTLDRALARAPGVRCPVLTPAA